MPVEYGAVFLSINSLNGKMYVGKTCRMELLLSGKYIGSGGTHYKRAKKKYGHAAFVIYVLQTVRSAKALNASEIRWISYYRTIMGAERLYNKTDGGDGLSSRFQRSRCATDRAYIKRLRQGQLRSWKVDAARKAKMSKLATIRNQKNCILKSPKGKIFKITNLQNFCLKMGLNYYSMRWVAQGRIFKRYGPYVGWLSLNHHPRG